MLIKRSVVIITTMITMLSLYKLGLSLPLAGISTFIVMITMFFIISIKRSKDRVSLLDDKCDPEAFLERTEKQMEITGKNPKFKALLSIDRTAGLSCMGRAEEAKEALLEIDKEILSKKNGSLLTYTINHIIYLYDLGEISEAERLYESELMKVMQDCIISRKPVFKRSIEFLMAERDFYKGKYEESKERFQKLYEERFSKRHRLAALYGLARINEKLGETQMAREQFRKVAEFGNKLYIVEESKERLK